jgi:secreted trypsin-like serine protease
MAEYGRITNLVSELKDRIELLAKEVTQLANGQSASGVTRTRSVATAATPTRATEVNVIPPTRTENPDSIVGGSVTDRFPDCCAVGSTSQYFCSGTLIAPNLVVTAGHCTGVEQVFLVGNDIDNPDGGETISVVNDIAHPTADIRVLVLAFDSSATPRHVAQGAEVDASSATLAGFGTIDFDGSFGYGVKREVDVPIVSLGCDSGTDPADFGCTPFEEMVAGHRGLGLDSCSGDSGGPLYIMGPLGDEYLLGATSRGVANADHTCGDGGVYVRVDQFVDWIMAETGVFIEGPLF